MLRWDTPSMGGGNLDNEYQKKIKQLGNEYGDILEVKCQENNINKSMFSIFTLFNCLCCITKTKVNLLLSKGSGGIPSRQWLDLSDKVPEPTTPQLVSWVQNQLGWTPDFSLDFSLSILDSTSEDRRSTLTHHADILIDSVLKSIEKQQRIVRSNPIFHGRDFELEDDLCFILMPFGEPFDTIYKNHIKPTIEKKFRITRADDIFKSSEVMEDIWEHINKAKFLIADLTERNPNVFYELGIAHTVGKEPLLIAQDKNDIRFDLKHRRYFIYTDDKEGLEKLETDLENAMKSY